MTLRDLIAADSVFLARELGEPVPYAPKGNRASPRTLTAVLMREPAGKLDGVAAGNLRSPLTRVFIPKDATIGLTAKPDCGGDQLCFAEHVGGAAEWRSIAAVVSEDDGGWLVRCR